MATSSITANLASTPVLSQTSAAYASTGEKSFTGTSAAAPHMAGAAALYKQAFPESTPDATLKYFTDHAKKPQGTAQNGYGAGLAFLDTVPQGAKTAAGSRTVSHWIKKESAARAAWPGRERRIHSLAARTLKPVSATTSAGSPPAAFDIPQQQHQIEQTASTHVRREFRPR